VSSQLHLVGIEPSAMGGDGGKSENNGGWGLILEEKGVLWTKRLL